MTAEPQNLKSRRIRESVRFPYFVLAFSIILTIGVTFLFYQSAQLKDSSRFNNSVDQIRTSMENRVGLYVAMLKAGRGFIETSNDLDRKKFTGFVESLELEKNYTGTFGIGFSKIVLPEKITDLETRMRAQGHENFKLFPDAQRGAYQSIVYLEPLNERNKRAIGFDMATDEVRRAALDRARDSGTAAATGKINLAQNDEQNREGGFLICLPIYENRQLPPTVEERRQKIDGFIYSPFSGNDFLKDVLGNAGVDDIEVRIYDGEAGAENLLAQSESSSKRNFAERISGDYQSENELQIAGRRWVVQYASLPAFARQSSVNWTPLIFLCGVIFSFLLFGMTYWESVTRAKLQQTAEVLIESEAQIQNLLEKEQSAREIAENANATKDEFISVVSHELRTPLNAIAGWARILKSEDLSKNTKDLALQKIEKNLRLQTRLVEDLLNYSQIVSSKVNFNQTDIDCSEIFDAVYGEIEPYAETKEISMTKENTLNGQQAFGDAEKIKIVFQNLLSNAVKFTPAGGQIKTLLRAGEDAVEFVVEDNGRGINPDFLPHIFDRFRQDESSTTRKYGGLGLGLAVSEHIVKLHNGTIEASSDGAGKGATFTVRLPVKS